MAHKGAPAAHFPSLVETRSHLAASGTTLSAYGLDRLRSLCRAIDFEREREITDLFEQMARSWGARSILDAPRWPSTVGDDDTPFEFSLGLGSQPELRVLVEPLGEAATLSANADAAANLLGALASRYGADLSRFERVRDIFVPRNPCGTFVIWVAACLSPSGDPKFKIYLNPFIQGEELAPALIEEALARLGFASAWRAVATGPARRGQDLDELMYFSLDLSGANDARIKVYARHRRATVADLEAAAGLAPSYRAGEIAQFIRVVGPEVDGTFESRAPLTCYAFSRKGGGTPDSVTTHFPINGYAPHDDIVRARVVSYLESVGLPAPLYARAVAGFANRPLDQGIGMQSYVSIRRERGKPRLTVYFPVEAYRPGQIASTPIMIAPPVASGLLERIEKRYSLAHHPCTRRIARAPADAEEFAVLCGNYEAFASAPFALKAAAIGARIGEVPLREMLLKTPRTPAPELPVALPGNEQSVTAPISSRSKADDRAEPARALRAELDVLCEQPDGYRALGALLAASLLESQLCETIASHLARDGASQSTTFSGSLLARRTASQARHAHLAAAARFLPDVRADAVWRGASELSAAAWSFFARLYPRTG